MFWRSYFIAGMLSGLAVLFGWCVWRETARSQQVLDNLARDGRIFAEAAKALTGREAGDGRR